MIFARRRARGEDALRDSIGTLGVLLLAMHLVACASHVQAVDASDQTDARQAVDATAPTDARQGSIDAGPETIDVLVLDTFVTSLPDVASMVAHANPVARDAARACDASVSDCGGVCGASGNDPRNCGASHRVCPIGLHASAVCTEGNCALACVSGYVPSGGACAPDGRAPRLIAPGSLTTVTSRHPVFHWQLPSGDDGAVVDVCNDRPCGAPFASFAVTGMYGAAPMPLPPGIIFWRVHGTHNGIVDSPSSAVWELMVPLADPPVTSTWGAILDINGDAFADVVVASNTQPYGPDGFEYLGGACGLQYSPSATFPTSSTRAFSAPIGAAGDVDGDGFADLFMGPAFFMGTPDGLITTPAVVLADPDPQTNDDFGGMIAGGGDIDQDGYADVIVGAPGSSPSGSTVYVYYGGANGLSPTPRTAVHGPPGTQPWFGFGSSIVGDLDADGYSDVLLAATPDREAFVYRGSAAGLDATSLTEIRSPDQLAFYFGYSSAAGDIDADGYPDFLSTTGECQLYAFHGGAAPTDWARGVSLGSFGRNGCSGLTALGDVDGDGLDDFAVSDSGSTVFPGSVNVFRSGGVVRDTLAVSGAFGFGSAIARTGDVDGDGYEDLVVGAYIATESDYSGAYFVRGGATGLDSLSMQGLGDPFQGWNTFGSGVALRTPRRSASLGGAVASIREVNRLRRRRVSRSPPGEDSDPRDPCDSHRSP